MTENTKTGLALALEDWRILINDDWRSLAVALYMVLIGYGVLVGIPVISTAWVTKLGFTEVEVGRVAGMDLGGLSAGAIVTAWIINRVNRRILVFIGIIIAVVANGMCLKYVDYDTVLWLRFSAGFGSGMYTAVAVAIFGMSIRPALAYNLMLFSFAFSQALEMRILPQLSMNGIYWVFIGCFLATIPFLKWIKSYPKTRPVEERSSTNDSNARYALFLPWICLFAIFLTYINIGAYWTYIELAALESNTNPNLVSEVLVWASLCSLLGCLIATLLSNRFGLLRPLLIALFTMAMGVGMLAFGINEPRFLMSVFTFNLLWIFTDVYQMGSLANFDNGGHYAAYLPAAQGLGQIVGPNLAASLLGLSFGYQSVFIMCWCAAMMAMLIYWLLYRYLRKQHPSIADAS
ncbi:MAG: MFS transporter [Gammaproteobacteria bacterium]|nr:MFS transporter [Gammaproteobacteria bacterium]